MPGRKNRLFAGSDNGGRTGAVPASLAAACERHGVDPFAYPRNALTRIAATPVSPPGEAPRIRRCGWPDGYFQAGVLDELSLSNWLSNPRCR